MATAPINVNWGEIARGLGDLVIYPLGIADAPGGGVDTPGIRNLDWTIDSTSDQQEGDNLIIAVARSPKKATGTLELGKNHLSAVAAMCGGTVAVTGTGATEICTYEEPATAPTAYVAIVGQTPSQDTGTSAYRVTIYKALCSNPGESIQQSSWNAPSIDFEAIPTVANKFIRREQFKTAVTPVPLTFV
jgi:hypothetical protein